MSWFADHAWLAWVGLALALGAIELASVDFVFLMLAGGALAGALAAVLGVPVVGQVLVSLAVAALAAPARPSRHQAAVHRPGRPAASAPRRQIGRSALVVSTVTENDGRIKLGGEIWTARTAPDDRRVPTRARGPGGRRIEGATAIVTGVAVGRDSE